MNKIKIKYLLNFFPFRLNFILLILFSIVGFLMTKKYFEAGDSKVMLVMSFSIMIFFGIVFFISMLSSFFPWLAFLYKKRILEKNETERKDIIKIYFEEKNCYTAGEVPVRIDVLGIHLPTLGFIKVRLIFKDFSQSKDIYLNQSIRSTNRRKHVGIQGGVNLWMPHKKDYPIVSSFVFFEDMFHLFSFAYREIELDGVYTVPKKEINKEIKIIPDKTEEFVTRILTRKVIEGEYLNYKKFESKDDVRRIVWKIYGKNRELVIRIPDRTNPYASHVNLFVSFYNSFPKQFDQKINFLLLDFYKQKIDLVYKSVMNQGFTIKHYEDQSVDVIYKLDEYEKPVFIINASNWQNHTNIDTYLNNKHKVNIQAPIILCLSSLCSINELENTDIQKLQSASIYYLKLSEIFNKKQKTKIKHLFVHRGYDFVRDAQNIKTSFFKRKLKKNEKAISRFFKEHKLIVVNV